MKNDIKKLYKKDPKLAIRVAEVLGYKIVAKKDTIVPKNNAEMQQMIDTEKELKKGLKQFVYDYIKARQLGNVKLAKEVKKNIDKIIKQKNLHGKMVYTYYGDPDKPGFKLPAKADVKVKAGDDARMAYQKAKKIVDKYMKTAQGLLSKHEKDASRDNNNRGYIGDLSYISEQLLNIINFLKT